MELNTSYDFSLLEEKNGWHADKNGDAIGNDISLPGGIVRFAVKEVNGDAVCYIEKAGKQRNYFDFSKRMSVMEMQEMVSELIKNVRKTDAIIDDSADSIIEAVQNMREKANSPLPKAENLLRADIAGGIDIEVVQFPGNAEQKEHFASGQIVPITLVKTDTLDEFLSFADVYSNAINVGSFSQKNEESIFQKYEYIDKGGERIYALEHSKDISEGFATDVYHFKEDFNAPSALYFLRQHWEQLNKKKTKGK
jgi:hypothetical protein